MNAFCFLSALALVVACCNASPSPSPSADAKADAKPSPILTAHDPIGIHKVPVTLNHDRTLTVSSPVAFAHHAAVPSIAVRHHGASHVAVGHHVAAPVAVSHHAAPLAVSHHAPVAVGHHAVTPLAVGHHAVAPATLGAHVPSHVAVTHHASHVTHGVPALAVAHHAPAVTHGVAPVAHAHKTYGTPVTSQYHSQDELGQYSFGYDAGTSSRDESRDAYGNVRGSYSYVDSYGKVQTQHYVADDYGFRVTGTNLPVQVTDHLPGHRYKRSYATFPASTGPLETVSHVGHVVHDISPVVHRVAPVVHNVAPVIHRAGPVVHAGHVGLGYAGVPHYGYSYHTGPSVSTYRSYNHPVYSHSHY